MNNFSDILSRIRTYYHDNTHSEQQETKGITPVLSEECIYELILGPLIEYYEESVPGISLPAMLAQPKDSNGYFLRRKASSKFLFI